MEGAKLIPLTAWCGWKRTVGILHHGQAVGEALRITALRFYHHRPGLVGNHIVLNADAASVGDPVLLHRRALAVAPLGDGEDLMPLIAADSILTTGVSKLFLRQTLFFSIIQNVSAALSPANRYRLGERISMIL